MKNYTETITTDTFSASVQFTGGGVGVPSRTLINVKLRDGQALAAEIQGMDGIRNFVTAMGSALAMLNRVQRHHKP